MNVRAAGAVGPQPGGDGVGEADELAADVVEVVEVVGERLLVADRLDVPLGLDRPVVATGGEVEEVPAVGPAERSRPRPPASSAARSPTVDTPIRRSRSSVAGPTPHSRPTGSGWR